MKKLIIILILSIIAIPVLALNDNLSLKEKELIGQAELDEEVILMFKDAETNEAIPDLKVTLRIKKNTKNTAQAEFMSDYNGIVKFDISALSEIDNGKMYVIAEKEGYIKFIDVVDILIGTVYRNSFALSKDLPLEKVRFVLSWSDKPRDLDLHLVGKGVRGKNFHISYRDSKDSKNQAKLDRDDRNGYGPETITMDRIEEDGQYVLFVNNYSREENLKSAVVHVYANNKLAKVVRLKSSLKKNIEVLKIENAELNYTNIEFE